MATPFITCAPTEKDERRIALLMSVFKDGSGQERDATGTRAGWKDLERVVSEFLGGHPLEKKQVFDVIVDATKTESSKYGVSLKTKCLGSSLKIQNLQSTGRVYMELTNSPAKLWAPLKAIGINESDFGKKSAQEMGDLILTTVHAWYSAYCAVKHVNMGKCIHMTISYSNGKNGERLHQIHSFPLGFPLGIIWKYTSDKCLRGFDPSYPGETLFDWYGLSGGQLKYYPKASGAIYSSSIFELFIPPIYSITEKSKVYWPEEWNQL